jgi:ribosomal protein L7/L12
MAEAAKRGWYAASESYPFRKTRWQVEGKKTMAEYGKAASKSVKSAMQREKSGKLRSGKGGKGGAVKSKKQAIAIGLSEARKKGTKVPKKKAS